jgi:hypothetical protein
MTPVVRLDGEEAINSLDAVEAVLVVAPNELAVAEIKDKSGVVEAYNEELEVLEADDDELEEDECLRQCDGDAPTARSDVQYVSACLWIFVDRTRGELPKAEEDSK